MSNLPEWATFILITSLRSSILLAIASLIALILRSSTARNRLLLWTATLIGCLALPVLSPAIPKGMRTAIPLLSAPDSIAPQLVVEQASTPIVASKMARAADPIMMPMGSPSDHTPLGESGVISSSARSGYWLVVLWCIGALSVSSRITVGHLRVRGLGRQAAKLEGAIWQADLEAASKLAGSGRSVVLRISPRASTPFTWGLWRPTILLPESANTWYRERRRLVLLHELIHIRRADWLVRLLAQLACAVYWFNPLAWLAARRLTVEQELACDDEVVARGARPSTYASHLLAIARFNSSRPFEPLAVLHMARRSQMEARLMAILDATRSRSRPAIWAPALLFLAAMVPVLAAVEPWIEESSSQQGGADRPLAEIIDELEVLEANLEPHQKELENLDKQLGPYESRLRDVEKELEPFESHSSAMESELAPFEQRLEEAERALEPLEDQLSNIEARLRPYVAQLESVGKELEPFHEEMESLARELEPRHREAERAAARMEALQEKSERITREARADSRENEASFQRDRQGAESEMQALRNELEYSQVVQRAALDQMQAIQNQLRARQEAMEALHEQIRPLQEEMSRVHRETEPIYRRIAEVHREMEPVHARMAEAHRAMEPTFRRMEAEHRKVQSHYQRMEEVHRDMEPVYRAMEKAQERMRPVFRDMEKLQRELDRAVRSELRSHLEAQLAPVSSPSLSFPHLTDTVRERVDIRIHNGRLHLRSSPSELRETLRSELVESRVGSEEEMEAAIDRAIRSISAIEIPD